MFKSLLKRILPSLLINQIQLLRESLDVYLASMASRTRLTSVLYYFIFSQEFSREMQAVLLARKRYHESRMGQSPSSYLLRRNIHRLEKGLVMHPRRPVFAEGYIVETLNFWELCIKSGSLSNGEMTWIISVISEYFSKVTRTEILEEARLIYMSIVERFSDLEALSGHVPIEYSSLLSNKITFDEFRELCEKRHSVRWFIPKPVPREILDAAINVAAMAPSACNRQPFKFYVFDEPARAQEIGSIPMGTAGFSHNFQAIAVVVGDLSAYPYEKDRHIIYIDSGLAVMQFQLALETQGLSSCTINWPDIERHERQMSAELGLQPYERPVMLVAVGYPLAEGKVPYSAKKLSEDIVVRPK